MEDLNIRELMERLADLETWHRNARAIWKDDGHPFRAQEHAGYAALLRQVSAALLSSAEAREEAERLAQGNFDEAMHMRAAAMRNHFLLALALACCEWTAARAEGTAAGRDWHIDNAAELLERAQQAEARVEVLTAALRPFAEAVTCDEDGRTINTAGPAVEDWFAANEAVSC